MDKYNKLVEYIKIHKISLEQDDEKLQSLFNSVEGDFYPDSLYEMESWEFYDGGLSAVNHILEYINEIDKA